MRAAVEGSLVERSDDCEKEKKKKRRSNRRSKQNPSSSSGTVISLFFLNYCGGVGDFSFLPGRQNSIFFIVLILGIVDYESMVLCLLKLLLCVLSYL